MTDDDIRRVLLKQRKLFGTQQEMAKALGVSEQNLGRFMAGKQGLLAAHGRGKLIRALGLEAAHVWLLRPKADI